MKRPNILFLMCDEHRADVSGFAGNNIIRTPNLDYIANRGVVFNNCYTPSPICIPARQCMMSGQYSNTCKCLKFGDDLEPNYMTFARQFSRYAYNTVACGKLHHTGVDQMQGWRKRIGMEDISVSPRYIEEKDKESFNEFSVPIKQVKWSQIKEVKRASPGLSRYNSVDEYTVDGALRFIDSYFCDCYYDRPERNTPLLLKVSLNKPHYPYIAKEDKFRYYLNRVEPYLEDVTFSHPCLSLHSVKVGVDATEREIRRATASYYAMIEEADEQFGKIMDKLREVGENLDDWIIVYTSDHGEMLGQHGVWEKQKFYEGSVRVPLIISNPSNFAHREVSENVNLVDLFRTLCDLAGLPTPDTTESRSLLGLMRGDSVGWDNESISQFAGRHFMIKQDSLKYQYYGEDMEEVLFDLERNKEETINFINCEEYRETIEKFRKRRKELGW